MQTSLLKELKIEKYTENFENFCESIFSKLKTLNLKYVDSKSSILVRASDILANHMFYYCNNNLEDKIKKLREEHNLFDISLP
ncbi:hypothetical protein [[Mycoplasma] phocae]|uniref:hypothetical protein n=1 Tax=[Mycoplasma] phocae TaxID=142651 RepID=UPI0035312921